MTSALLIGTVLAAEVLFNGTKNSSGETYVVNCVNNGQSASKFGGYGTICDLGNWGDGSDFSNDNTYWIKSNRIATIGAAGCTEFLGPNLYLGQKDAIPGWLMVETKNSPTVK